MATDLTLAGTRRFYPRSQRSFSNDVALNSSVRFLGKNPEMRTKKQIPTLSRAKAQQEIHALRAWACGTQTPEGRSEFICPMHILVMLDLVARSAKNLDRMGVVAWMPIYGSILPILDITLVPLGRRYKAKFIQKLPKQHENDSFPYSRRFFRAFKQVMSQAVVNDSVFLCDLMKGFLKARANADRTEIISWYEDWEKAKQFYHALIEKELVAFYPEFNLIGITPKGQAVLVSLDQWLQTRLQAGLLPADRSVYRLGVAKSIKSKQEPQK